MKLTITFGDEVNEQEKSLPLVQHTDDVDELLADAQAIYPMLRDVAKSFLHEANEDITTENASRRLRREAHLEIVKNKDVSFAKPKSRKRIAEKCLEPSALGLEHITDYARGSIQPQENDQIAALVSVIEWAHEHNAQLPHDAQIISTKNRFRTPGERSYSDFQAKIAIPIPGKEGKFHIAELAVRHDGYEQQIAENLSHPNYRLARTLSTKISSNGIGDYAVNPSIDALQKYDTACTTAHRQAWRDHHLEDIDFDTFKRLRDKRYELMLQAARNEHQGITPEIETIQLRIA